MKFVSGDKASGVQKMTARYRPISSAEIAELTSRRCSCDDWSKVEVAEGFDQSRISAVHFGGRVRLGVFAGQVNLGGGIRKACGISDAAIYDCRIGNNVYINGVGRHIANYVIEDDVIIEDVDLLAVERRSSFGNGVAVCVVNEAGGREVRIWDFMSVQTAYVTAFYRDRPELIERLETMISAYAESVSSSMGLVGKGARISNCGIIRDVRVDAPSVSEGASMLENGSVNSCAEEPVYIGCGVSARDFILCSGSEVSDGCRISRCFVGQETILSEEYSAQDCVFSANCQCFQGEACSVFAGPYTVTHHKSTLLIAGYYSFFNAGSGTNQSNHMYKLGPVHQGILERGSKTGSDCHMLWPCRVGAFTVVTGRGHRAVDTSELPFSYLIRQGGQSILAAGANLGSVGMLRDGQKWAGRDRRRESNKLDCVNLAVFSPYTAEKMLNAGKLLDEIEKSTEALEWVDYNNVRIRCSSIARGIELYRMGVDKFVGGCLVRRLEGRDLSSVEQLRGALSPTSSIGGGRWVDLAGLTAPQEVVEQMLAEIESGTIGDLERLQQAFEAIHKDYADYEWVWVADVIERGLGRRLGQITAGDVIELIRRYVRAIEELARIAGDDAKKEFSQETQIGYGIDGDATTRQHDFAAVRGDYETNSFICELEAETTAQKNKSEQLIERLEQIG